MQTILKFRLEEISENSDPIVKTITHDKLHLQSTCFWTEKQYSKGYPCLNGVKKVIMKRNLLQTSTYQITFRDKKQKSVIMYSKRSLKRILHKLLKIRQFMWLAIFSLRETYSQFYADFFTFTKVILNKKLHF